MEIKRPPKTIDVVILSLFAVFITAQPYFMHGKINLFEEGLYLPGINAVLNGLVPYRDVFHLRGPMELYVPALLMSLFGEHITVLKAYFYAGNVLSLILGILIARELYQTRFILYLMAPVFIGRTWPRVVFAIWGGMRFALGLLALLCMIKFFKTEKKRWIGAAGVVTAFGLLTSIEIGILSILGMVSAWAAAYVFQLKERMFLLKSALLYAAGFLCITAPYVLYLIINQAFIPYLESTYAIVVNMQKVIDPHLVSVYPRNLIEALAAMFNPVAKNFRHMTPSYLYIFILTYLIVRFRQKRLTATEACIFGMGVYGFVMYNTSFRGIWAAQFEMSLQIVKILLFFLLEIFFLYLWENRKRWNKYFVGFCIIALIGSSWGYAIQRYNHRFFTFKFIRDKIAGKDTAYLKPLNNEPSRALKIKRAKGVIVPDDQADELEEIISFLENRVDPKDKVFMYPELGTYNFLADRPFVGRFPIATFSWFMDHWHTAFMEELQKDKPRYVILTKEMPHDWNTVYLGQEINRRKYTDVMQFIQSNYRRIDESRLSSIYRLR